MSTVQIKNLHKHYGPHEALKAINLDIEPGEFIVMVGPSGCGKSTLLKTIAGLEDSSSGTITIAGKDVTEAEPGDRGIAMVFQSYALYPHMTVAENMGFGLKMAKRPKAEIEAAVARAAKILKLESQLDKRPASMSGGQRQRVAIGRAITRSPEVFLFDEPLSNLDASLRTQMRVEISSLHNELGATMIYVTHDQVEAMTMADRIVVLRDGRIEQVGAPLELYENPENQFVAGFMGAPRMNFFDGTVISISGDTVKVSLDDGQEIEINAETKSLKTGESVTLGIRPEHISLDKGDLTLPAQVALVEHLGRDTVFYAEVSGLKTTASEGGHGTFTVQLSVACALNLRQEVTLRLASNDIYLFSPDGQRLTPRRAILSHTT